MWFGAILISSLYEVSESSPHFSIEYSVFFISFSRNHLYVLDTNLFSGRCLVNIFSLSELLFSILMMSLDEPKL